MFRLSYYMKQLFEPTPVRVREGSIKPVVIWNLTRRCNLKCRHCYAVAADHDFPGELSRDEAIEVLDDLAAYGIPALILSGGEPLSRPDT
ncbi:MAG: radical SAM protein, partial [Hyphomicrobiaceae bacterium]|nr:radical SAM protein [Hyphomicrobiaceae bacterium]